MHDEVQMDRRSILRLGAVTGAGLFGPVIIPGLSRAEKFDEFQTPLAGSVFYTKEHPGRWAKKAPGHLPMIERRGDRIRVTTHHPMTGYKHYIIKHMLLDEDFHYVREKVFDPGADKPVSEYDISGLKRELYAISMCNLHDTWISTLRF
jgi:superoxide reductase